MKEYSSFFAVMLIVFALTIAGCRAETSATDENKSATPSADSPSPAADSQSAAPPVGPELPPPVLIGRYAMSEVRHDGQVSMVSQANVTEITFTANGTYTREARRGGQIDHTDSGDFMIDTNGTLILRTQISNGRLKAPATEKRYQFTLSAGGDELILVGSEGREAVFRRR